MSGEQERAERAEKAQRLQAENPDLSVRAIAEKLGVSVGTAHRDLKPDAKRRANEASKKAQRQMRPRMEKVEKRLAATESRLGSGESRIHELETTVVDLSDRLARLEDAAALKDGHRLKGPSRRTKQAVEKIRRLARSQAPKTSRAK